MKILIACEESQTLCKAFRSLGYEAWSCDIEPCSGGHPEWHLQCNVLDILGDSWDMMIAHPPCTHISAAGARWWKEKASDGRQQAGIDFFMKMVDAPIELKCIENPVGIMSTVYRKPDQIVHPWQFGDEFSKKTCLWLTGLPPLVPTKIVGKGEFLTYSSGKRLSKWYAKASNFNDKKRARIRSMTFPGMARAMAEQWGRKEIR